jgi:hypothetical protein
MFQCGGGLFTPEYFDLAYEKNSIVFEYLCKILFLIMYRSSSCNDDLRHWMT